METTNAGRKVMGNDSRGAQSVSATFSGQVHLPPSPYGSFSPHRRQGQVETTGVRRKRTLDFDDFFHKNRRLRRKAKAAKHGFRMPTRQRLASAEKKVLEQLAKLDQALKEDDSVVSAIVTHLICLLPTYIPCYLP